MIRHSWVLACGNLGGHWQLNSCLVQAGETSADALRAAPAGRRTQADVSWLPRVSTEQGSLLVLLRSAVRGSLAGKAGEGGDGGDGIGMARTRKGRSK